MLIFRKQKLSVLLMVAVLIVGLTGVANGFTTLDATPSGVDETPYYFGDVNADDQISVGDAISILRHIVGLAPFDENLEDDEALQRADVNLDGAVSVGDAIQVLRYIVGLTQEFEPDDPATVITETALLIVMGSDVETVNIARDIVLTDPLDIERDITIDGAGNNINYAINGEVIVSEDVESFTAKNIEIETLTLNGGGNESVNLNNAIIDELIVNAPVNIIIDDESEVNEAYFGADAKVTGGGKIAKAVIGTGVDPVFGDDPPQETVYELEPGAIDAGKSGAVPFLTTVTAGSDNVELDITIADAYGNPVSGSFDVIVGSGEDVWYDSSAGEFLPQWLLPLIQSTTAGAVQFVDGEAVLTLTVNEAGDYVGVPVTVDGLEIDTFDITVVAADPVGFALNVGVSSLKYTFSSFVDEYGNEIDVAALDFDKDISVITLVAKEGQGEDITVPLADLPDFVIDDNGGVLTITVPTEEIVGMGPEAAGVFYGLDLNVHTKVDAKLADAGGEWEVQLSDVVTERPALPTMILNNVFVGMVNHFISSVESAMHDDNNLLHCEDVEVGDGHWDWLPVNLIAAWEAYGPADGICEFMEDVVLAGSLDDQREYLDWVKDALESVEGMLYDEQFIHQAVGPIHHGIVNADTVGTAKEQIEGFENKYGDLEINAATDEGRDNVIRNEKNNVRMAMDHAFNIAGKPGAGSGRFNIVAPWLESVANKVDHFRVEVEEFEPDDETPKPEGVSLIWDDANDAYYFQVTGDGFETGGVSLELISGTELDELAFYFEVDRVIHIYGQYDAEGNIIMGPLPVSIEPESGAKGVKTDAEIWVEFDKDIAITGDPEFRIEYYAGDDQWSDLENVDLVVDGAILKILHEGLDYNTDYMVEVHGHTVKCAVTGIGNRSVSWHFTTGAPMDVEPDMVYVDPYDEHGHPEDVSFEETFTLTLNYGDFSEGINYEDFELGGIFKDWDDADLAVIEVVRDAENHNQAVITVEGYINIPCEAWHEFEGDEEGPYTEGIITALPSGHDIGAEEISAVITIREKMPDIWVNPDHLDLPVYDGENDIHFDEMFELGLGYEQFTETFSAEDVQLGGIFADLTVIHVEPHPQYDHHYFVTLGEFLNITQEDWFAHWDEEEDEHLTGTITIKATGHTGDEAVTAEVRVYPKDLQLINPQFSVSPCHGGSVNGHGWPSGTEITITIEEDGGEPVLTADDIFTDEYGQFEYWVSFAYPIHPGYTVTVSGGGLTMEHTVRYIAITGFDTDIDKVYGEAEPGAWIDVIVPLMEERDYHEWPRRTVKADIGGNWEADFSAEVGGELWAQPYDLTPGIWGFAEQEDDNGNNTVIQWSIPDPQFTVFPAEDFIMGFDWPSGTQVTVERDGSVIFDETVSPNEYGYFNISFEIDILAGDFITVSGGDYENTHTVTALSLEVNRETGEVIGIASPGIDIRLELQEPRNGYGPPNIIEQVNITPEADGSWSYDFRGALADNQTVFAMQSGDDGGSTAVSKSVE